MEENKDSALRSGGVHVGSKEGPAPFVGLSLPPKAKPAMELWMKVTIAVLAFLAGIAIVMIVVAACLERTRKPLRTAFPDGEPTTVPGVTQVVPSPNVVNAFIDVPVTNYVVRRMDVLVEYPVTNYVIKPHVVVVEYPVTNVVVQPYEVVVDYPVTNMVVRPYGITVDVPVTNVVYRPAADGAAAYSDVTVSAVVDPPRQVRQPEPSRPTLPAIPAVPVARRPMRSMTPYRVAYGDTVGGLARRFGFRLRDFVVCNPGVDMERILVGQVVQLPGDLDVDR